jgi:flagella basal body P-ring formation protein FlgA
MRTIIYALILLMPGFSALAATQPATADQVRKAAVRFLDAYKEQQAQEGYTVAYETGTIDSRLSLASCTNALTVEFTGNPMKSTHPSLRISCEGERPWRLYVTATVTIDGPALVATRPLTRGERITSAMVTTEQVTLNASHQGALTHLSDVLGMEVRRSVNPGSLITPNLLTAPDAVARGDHVIIIAGGETFSISTRGKALANASVGEQVLVENLGSSRTVKAYVVGPGRVKIPM